MSQTNETESIAALALAQTAIQHIEDIPTVIHHEDAKVSTFENLLPHPKRIQAAPHLHTLPDLISYLHRHHNPDKHCAVFADFNNRTFHVIFDYHDRDKAEWGGNTASLRLRLSRQWEEWIQQDREWMGQSSFADFLDDHLEDVLSPTGAEMMTIAENLTATSRITFKSAQRLQDGQIDFRFSNEKGEESTKVPEKFKIAIPVWQRQEERIEIEVSLRYRANQEGLRFFYKLRNPDIILEQLWDQSVKALIKAAAAEVSIYQGKPV